MLYIRSLYATAEALLGPRVFQLVRYIASGGTAALCNFVLLYLLVEFVHMHYLWASVSAFIFSLAVSFTLHKFVTFHDHEHAELHWQFSRYLIVILTNLGLNTLVVFLLVEKAHVWYLFAQIFGAALVAVTGYIGYKTFVFRTTPTQAS